MPKEKNKVKNLLAHLTSGVSDQELINFARHLSVGTKSGLSIIETLRLIKKQTGGKKFKNNIDDIISDINSGRSLSQSLRRFSYIFGDFFVSMIEVGESGGRLSQTLMFLSKELEKQRKVKRRVRSAMIYPAIILVATIGITLFLTLFIFPKLMPIFTSLQVDLPFTTKLVIGTLNFVQHYGLYVLGGLIVLGIGSRLLLLVEKVRFQFDRVILSVPFVSSLVTNVTLTNFTRSLGVLLNSGMTLMSALEVAKDTFNNRYYRYHIEKVIKVVERGEEMTRHLEKRPDLFPPMLVGMIRVGEGVGNLEENLRYLSEYYESELDEEIQSLTTILEPILLLIMGIIVGFVALSIITPIYKVTQGL